jgi:glycogen operon protein
MLLMGDEVRRTQQGNNNAYCQDNVISWFDWGCVEKHADVFRFVQQLIRFTQSLQLFAEEHFLYVGEQTDQPYLIWHGVKVEQPDWSPTSRTLAFMLYHPQAKEQLYVVFNAYWENLTFELPPLIQSHQRWHRIVDTAQPTPEDLCNPDNAPMVTESTYSVMARSSVVLMARSN